MLAQTTTAILIERHGPPDVLVERVVPLRDPGPDEVRLRVHAVGVNFADLVMRAGMYGTVPPRPYSPGFEVAGTVIAVGPQVTQWRPGDRAVALIRYGGYARELSPEFYRKQAELHKRLMVLACCMLTIPGAARMFFIGDPPNLLVMELIFLSPVYIGIVRDWLVERRVYPVYVIGLAVLALMPLRMVVVGWPVWQSFTHWLAGVVA